MNTKVVDLSTSYNFHKGCMGFFSLDLNLGNANFECQPVLGNSKSWFARGFSQFSLPKLQCHST
jgi:hypothetical protein